MQISEATLQDIPEIVKLLKSSLGEGLMPKSEAFFLWKHIQNPFGKSKTLIAKEDGKIIGFRSFMRWQWVMDGLSVSAVRAVDTATHPNHQGKGIFKKLTLQAIEECKLEGVDMVFNSPNLISMQGYLKMDWRIAGRLPMYFGLGSLMPRLFSNTLSDVLIEKFSIEEELKKISASFKCPISNKFLHTPISYDYLKWRYCDCPVAKYGAVINADKFGIVFRVKRINKFIELRVCETWAVSKQDAIEARKALKKICKIIRPLVISCSPSPLFMRNNKNVLGLHGPFEKGPITTIRSVAMNDLDNFNQFNHWQPSLGSMELF